MLLSPKGVGGRKALGIYKRASVEQSRQFPVGRQSGTQASFTQDRKKTMLSKLGCEGYEW
jgi:hypothetical protein